MPIGLVGVTDGGAGGKAEGGEPIEKTFLNVTTDNGKRLALLEDYDSGAGTKPTFKLNNNGHIVTGNTEMLTVDGHGVTIPRDMKIRVSASISINGGSAAIVLRVNGGSPISATKAYDKQTKSVGDPSLHYVGTVKEGDILTFGADVASGSWSGMTLAFEETK